MAYGAYCFHARHNSESTIRQNFAGINHHWSRNGYVGEGLLSIKLVKKFLKGVLRRQGGVQQDVRQGVTIDGLLKLFNSLDFDSYTDLRAMAWLSMGFVGSMRVNEWKKLTWRQISWLKDAGGVYARLYLPTEKGLLTRRLRSLDIVDTPDIVAATLLWNWWRRVSTTKKWSKWLRFHGTELVFPNLKGKPLRSAHTKPYFKAYERVNGVSNITAHSLRIGSTTEFARNGASDRIIQANGRWHSDAYQIYERFNYQILRDNRRRFLRR